jgi:hypothetical protein
MKMITNKSKNKSGDLTKKIKSYIDDLSQLTDEARFSEQMLIYLDACSKFYKYSANNQWLIYSLRPDATQVAGFHRWKQMGRYVKKGERGIPILCPVIYKQDHENNESNKVLRGFKAAYVFDITQTSGKDLPPTPEWRSFEKNTLLQDKLFQFALEKGISVSIKYLPGEIQGMSSGGKILISPDAGTKTLIHEIAHELMHQGEEAVRGNKNIVELEAEAVAYVVAKHFGIKNLASPNYLALHGANAKLIQAHMQRIQEVASEIINKIEETSSH